MQLLALSSLSFPIDFTRNVSSLTVVSREFSLPEETTEAINVLISQEKLESDTPYIAAFKLLLARYCGQTDFYVGIPEPTRCRFTEDESILMFLKSTQEQFRKKNTAVNSSVPLEMPSSLFRFFIEPREHLICI